MFELQCSTLQNSYVLTNTTQREITSTQCLSKACQRGDGGGI